MMEQEFEGRSVAEAAIKACEALGVTRSHLKYEVVSETGELLTRLVRIKAAPLKTPEAPRKSAALDAHPQEAPQPQSPSPEKPTPLPPRSPPTGTAAGADAGRTPPPRPAAAAAAEDRPPRRPRSRRPDRDRPPSERAARALAGDAPSAHDAPPPRDGGIEALLKLDGITPKEVPTRPAIPVTTPRAERAMALTTELARLLHFELTPRLVADEDIEMHIDLVGADETRAIGKKGEVLLALQFVLNRMLSRGDEEGEQVVVLDAGGYRERRRAALQELARRLATRCVAERKAVRLTPMSAHDRRVFHLTLQQMPEVATRSEGDGLYRNLLIIPAEFV